MHVARFLNPCIVKLPTRVTSYKGVPNLTGSWSHNGVLLLIATLLRSTVVYNQATNILVKTAVHFLQCSVSELVGMAVSRYFHVGRK